MSKILIFVMFFSILADASFEQYFYEIQYLNLKEKILANKSNLKLNPFNEDLYFDVLWDLDQEKNQKNTIIHIPDEELRNLTLLGKIKFLALNRGSVARSNQELLTEEIIKAAQDQKFEDKEITYLTSYQEYLPSDLVKEVREIYADNMAVIEEIIHQYEPMNKETILDLFQLNSQYSIDENLEYQNQLKLYLFCRNQRIYPCLLIVKDGQGNVVKTEDGNVFSIPLLAKSSRDLPSHIRNGQTPQGVHKIDSVMPLANNPAAFGKFRRLILNFISNKDDEAQTKEFLTESAINHLWWKQAIVSRDVDREFLRIHGTGGTSLADRPYYPHVPTSGCISSREGTYQGIEYQDQRVLLDQLMTALNLVPSYENEEKIKGILYVIELDHKKAAVKLEDLNFLNF